ncbi:MAG: hypothetical protein IJX80_09085 [Clostridia bacterium]|nr:hypothetical protein [Clostridia bacterium]
MDRFCRFISDHRLLSVVLFSIIECAAYALILWENPVWLVVGCVCLVFVNVLYVQVCANKLIVFANAELTDACDPMPLLEECNRQLAREKPGMRYQMLQIDKTAALANMGDFAEAHEILSGMNIDKYAGTLSVHKMIYYHNFSAVCHMMEKWDAADLYHQKAAMLYNDLRSAKQKKLLNWSLLSAEWEMHYRHGDYARALTVLDQMQPETLLQKVDHAWGYGNVYAAMGDLDRALKNLQYVADYPRLYTGRRAKELLAELLNVNK